MPGILTALLDAANPFATETVRGLEDVVHEHGCAVYLCSTDGSPDREARYLRLLEEQRCAGHLRWSWGSAAGAPRPDMNSAQAAKFRCLDMFFPS